MIATAAAVCRMAGRDYRTNPSAVKKPHTISIYVTHATAVVCPK